MTAPRRWASLAAGFAAVVVALLVLEVGPRATEAASLYRAWQAEEGHRIGGYV